ncbi:MAG: VOC family protein [Acidobacteria bacterium]|nr:VOC family protein [Acidobacteriota bacterium]MCA1610448.1 VOC family protein [Acidobacteriota bacterium]
MKSKIKIPPGYEAVVPYLIVQGAAAAIDYYKKAFGAKEVMRMPGPDGKIGHADLIIGGGHVMLADESPGMGHRGPTSFGGSPVSLCLYVDDVDTVVNQAAAAGGKITRPVADQFYGDRTGGLTDPFGHIWFVMTHVEDVSNEEMVKRAAAMAQSHSTTA